MARSDGNTIQYDTIRYDTMQCGTLLIWLLQRASVDFLLLTVQLVLEQIGQTSAVPDAAAVAAAVAMVPADNGDDSAADARDAAAVFGLDAHVTLLVALGADALAELAARHLLRAAHVVRLGANTTTTATNNHAFPSHHPCNYALSRLPALLAHALACPAADQSVSSSNPLHHPRVALAAFLHFVLLKVYTAAPSRFNSPPITSASFIQSVMINMHQDDLLLLSLSLADFYFTKADYDSAQSFCSTYQRLSANTASDESAKNRLRINIIDEICSKKLGLTKSTMTTFSQFRASNNFGPDFISLVLADHKDRIIPHSILRNLARDLFTRFEVSNSINYTNDDNNNNHDNNEIANDSLADSQDGSDFSSAAVQLSFLNALFVANQGS
ncbi:hypothetical protein HK100_000407, partial [Physocladia obscura]